MQKIGERNFCKNFCTFTSIVDGYTSQPYQLVVFIYCDTLLLKLLHPHITCLLSFCFDKIPFLAILSVLSGQISKKNVWDATPKANSKFQKGVKPRPELGPSPKISLKFLYALFAPFCDVILILRKNAEKFHFLECWFPIP